MTKKKINVKALNSSLTIVKEEKIYFDEDKQEEEKMIICLKIMMLIIMMIEFDTKLYCFESFNNFVIRIWIM